MRNVATQGIRRAALTAALITAATLGPAQADDAKTPPPPNPSQQFDELAFVSPPSLAPTPSCEMGLQMTGLAVDVRNGLFDGLWWSSLCIDSAGNAFGRWAVFYITGRAADAIVGTWQAESVTADTNAGAVTYAGTYALTHGFGPFTGIRGGGDFSLFIGAQPWITLSGEYLEPEDVPGSVSQ